ncbi:MAG TPA: PAS domain S-box protein [Terriglobales bacterium]|nr:PAS domain S-box protein [Terriglobales bacterium]
MSLNFFEDPLFPRLALEQLPVGIYLVDRDGRIRFWNRGAEHIVGHLAHEVIGRLSSDHTIEARDGEGEAMDQDSCPVMATLRDGQPHHVKANFLHKEGHRVPVTIRSQPILRHGDSIDGAIVLFEEHSESQHDPGELSSFGFLDPTTGIPGHRLTRAVLADAMAAMEQSQHKFGILRIRILGLDEFRSKHGPRSIVPFLRTTAHTLQHGLDLTNFLGRWGEDEFIAVLPSSNPIATATAAATAWTLVTGSEVRWWGDRFPIQAVVMHAVAQPGDKLDRLLNGLEPTHAAAAGRAIGVPGGSPKPQVRAAQAAERG